MCTDQIPPEQSEIESDRRMQQIEQLGGESVEANDTYYEHWRERPIER